MPGGLSLSPLNNGSSNGSPGFADKITRSVSFSADAKSSSDTKRRNVGKHSSGSKTRITQVRELEAELGPVSMEDVIEFTSQVYYAKEEEGHFSIEVNRLGNCIGKATVDYATRDGSAVAGRKYEAMSGSLEFNAGERRKTIHVKILSDEAFDATLEFALYLENPRGARLGKYLHECRISILDDDAFPTNKYKTLLNAGLLASAYGVFLHASARQGNEKGFHYHSHMRSDLEHEVCVGHTPYKLHRRQSAQTTGR